MAAERGEQQHDIQLLIMPGGQALCRVHSMVHCSRLHMTTQPQAGLLLQWRPQQEQCIIANDGNPVL